MIDPHLKDLWTPTGLLLGFQVTFFKWRIEREAILKDKNEPVWLPPSDYLGLLGMIVFVFGVILLPLIEVIDTFLAQLAFGIGAFIFIGQCIGLAGHYKLYNIAEIRNPNWAPIQEIIVVATTIVLCIAYAVTYVNRC